MGAAERQREKYGFVGHPRRHKPPRERCPERHVEYGGRARSLSAGGPRTQTAVVEVVHMYFVWGYGHTCACPGWVHSSPDRPGTPLKLPAPLEHSSSLESAPPPIFPTGRTARSLQKMFQNPVRTAQEPPRCSKSFSKRAHHNKPPTHHLLQVEEFRNPSALATHHTGAHRRHSRIQRRLVAHSLTPRWPAHPTTGHVAEDCKAAGTPA